MEGDVILYHVTTPKKVQRYGNSGRIIKPVRGFTTEKAAMAWAMKTGRSVILEIESENFHKLPDHHNDFGEAWWFDEDVKSWKCIFSPKNA
jgi:antibiotic biosynthesis monooxygenase (ABM) superfamily enzyme